MDNYIDINKELWNARTEAHIDSDFYDNENFKAGANSLKEIELPLLGDVSGKTIIHLQCHFGQDSISLARAGAKVTGIDFSEAAINYAKELNTICNTDVEFVLCDVYNTYQTVQQQYDMVFTSYGTIGWLPDIKAWALEIAKLLKPGGELVFVEFHPVIWIFDNDFTMIRYSYFNKEEIVEVEESTYADKEAEIQKKSISWNHPLSDVFTALIEAGLRIEIFQEFDYSPYNCFNNTFEVVPGKFQVGGLHEKVPMVYAIKAIKQ